MIASKSLPSALRRKPQEKKGLVEDRIHSLVGLITGVPTNSLERFSINFLELHIGFSSLEDCEQILLEQTSKLYHDYEVEKEKKRKTQLSKQKRLKQLTDLQIELRETEKHFKYYLETKEELRSDRQLRRQKKYEIEETSEVRHCEMEKERERVLKEIEKSKKKTETEITFLKNSQEKLVENQRKVEAKLDEVRKEIEEIKFRIKQLTDHVQLNQNEPKRIFSQSEVIHNFVSNVESQRRKISNDTVQMKDKIRAQKDEKTSLTKQESKMELEMGTKNKTMLIYSHDIQKLEKQIADLLSTGNEIEGTMYKLKQTIRALKTNYYLEMKKMKKKKKQLCVQREEVSRFEEHIENIRICIKHNEEKKAFLSEKREKLTDEYNATKERIDERKLEVDVKIHRLVAKEGTNRALQFAVKRKGKELKLFECQLLEYIRQGKDVKSDILKLKQERERYTRALSTEKQRFLLLSGEMKMHHFVMKELQKEYVAVHKRRKHTLKVYQMVKMERNKKAKMIQDFGQTLGHITRNKTILENEHEILQRKSLEKEKDINKFERKVNHLISLREESKRKQSKLAKEMEGLELQKDEKNNEVRKLQKCIQEDGEELSDLKSQFEVKVEERNYNGMQLMDRNDELCILHEKLDFQKSVIKRGEFEINKKEEQIRLLTIQLQSMLRELIIHNERLPLIQSLIQEKDNLSREVEKQVMINRRLSEYIEDYTANKTRFREVKSKMYCEYDEDFEVNSEEEEDGFEKISTTVEKNRRNNNVQSKKKKKKGLSSLMDERYPKIEEIKEKIDEIQKKILQRKERYLEKQLILKELSNTTDKMRKLCMESRDYYLDLSMNLNRYKRATEQKNRELKALMSELSIVQAQKMESQIKNKQLKKNIVKFTKRFEKKNEPPSKEMFKMWEKEELIKERREEYYQSYVKRKKFEKKNAEFATITRTKATKRPNAYVPDAEGVMALPKPYMLKPYLPTKASKLGGIRHIKKPSAKRRNVYV